MTWVLYCVSEEEFYNLLIIDFQKNPECSKSLQSNKPSVQWVVGPWAKNKQTKTKARLLYVISVKLSRSDS